MLPLGLEVATKNGLLDLEVHTDSYIVAQGMNKRRKKWLNNGWRKADGELVDNLDLWSESFARNTAAAIMTPMYVLG